MHEHGLIDRLVKRALALAAEQDKRLVGVHVRLGAMATWTPDQLRHEFDHIAREHLGLDVVLHVEAAPDHPAGVEIVAIDVA